MEEEPTGLIDEDEEVYIDENYYWSVPNILLNNKYLFIYFIEQVLNSKYEIFYYQTY